MSMQCAGCVQALELYQAALQQPNPDPGLHVLIAACHYALGEHEEASVAAAQVSLRQLSSHCMTNGYVKG